MNEKNILRDYSYYMDAVKIIRDLVLGYVYLTKFDMELIDTPEFQRLKDIRQLTCQHVYPSARHTRFEHSLGVMELTRQAIKNLNRNGIIGQRKFAQQSQEGIFGDELQFNAALAALLHDIGHCPFSHMGEVEFDGQKVWNELLEYIRDCPSLVDTNLLYDLENTYTQGRKPSVHEQLSCIVILERLYDKLSAVLISRTGGTSFGVDFEFVIRCIVGVKYSSLKNEKGDERKKKNAIISLIYSDIFDMDKLDYIMRDSLLTGIENPGIDTQRLFRNMYLKDEDEYSIVFSHRAEPALQNMIEARDNLYRYVYNHHAAVFSDFMYSYIFRRLDHNVQEFRELVEQAVEFSEGKTDKGWLGEFSGEWLDIYDPILHLGMVPKSYLFSSDSILEQQRSDSDMVSLLRGINYELARCNFRETSALALEIKGEASALLQGLGVIKELSLSADRCTHFIKNIERVYRLIAKYQRREFLKPWWKTNFEFSDFIQHNFRDDSIRKRLCEWICQKEGRDPRGDEVRSQLAKHVIYITQQVARDSVLKKKVGLLETLEDGDFFVIERAPRFYGPDAIRHLDIVLKNSALLGSRERSPVQETEYYVKELPQVIPQRDYYAIYPKTGFYIFSKPLGENWTDAIKRSKHYSAIEKIFVFVATWLVKNGATAFKKSFTVGTKEERRKKEQLSKEAAWQDFAKSLT